MDACLELFNCSACDDLFHDGLLTVMTLFTSDAD